MGTMDQFNENFVRLYLTNSAFSPSVEEETYFSVTILPAYLLKIYVIGNKPIWKTTSETSLHFDSVVACTFTSEKYAYFSTSKNNVATLRM